MSDKTVHIEEKLNKIEERKKFIGSRNDRRRKVHSDRFNEIFNFFLMSYRCGVLNFCGTSVDVNFDRSGDDAKISFKKFENGVIKLDLKSRHNNILRAVIIGKKGWGLWLKEWTDGISDFLFTKDEIIKECFTDFNIKVPESLMLDFDNMVEKKHRIKFDINKQFLKL